MEEQSRCRRSLSEVSRMLAAWVQPLVNAQSWDVLAPFAHAVLALDETTLDPLARKLPSLRHFKKGTVEVLPGHSGHPL